MNLYEAYIMRYTSLYDVLQSCMGKRLLSLF